MGKLKYEGGCIRDRQMSFLGTLHSSPPVHHSAKGARLFSNGPVTGISEWRIMLHNLHAFDEKVWKK